MNSHPLLYQPTDLLNRIVEDQRMGLAQLSRKELDVRKDRVATNNFRIQSQILNFPTCRIMWMNAYLPTDPHTVNFDDSELMEVLCEITNIIEKSGYTDVIFYGDLSWSHQGILVSLILLDTDTDIAFTVQISF